MNRLARFITGCLIPRPLERHDMKNELFGELTFGNGLEGYSSITLYGTTEQIDLVVNCEEGEKITDAQRASYMEYKRNVAKLLKDIEEGIFIYYKTIYKEYQQQYAEAPEEIDQRVPTVSYPEDMKRLVKPTSFIIDYDFNDGDPIHMGVLFNCTWDPSHGIAAVIISGEVVEITTQDNFL